MGSINEKNRVRKSRDTAPLRFKSQLEQVGRGALLFAAKLLDFESTVKVNFSSDLPQLLDQAQACSELQLIHFIQ